MMWLALFLLLAGDYAARIEQWRVRREVSLKAEDGWLTVAGLIWLREGDNTLPEAPGAVFALRAGAVSVTVNGQTRQLPPDSSDSVAIGRKKLFLIKRQDRFGIRLKDPDSRLRREFTGLKWFPVKESYRVAGRFVADRRKIAVANVIGQTDIADSPGYVVFSLGGRELRLRANGGGAGQLFFVFRDLTAGKETYGAGRFLDAELPGDGRVTLDFNRAYNPPCAFTPYATCPLPPKENRLDVRIEAGELNYGGH